MSMFTLAISCLTTSNLPWFMDLTFQVPMQYCSLQHRTLLLSPIPFMTGCYFCFGSGPSLFLELFLHWSPVAYWAHTNLGSSSFSVLSFCLFIPFIEFSRQEYWSAFPVPSPVDHVLSEPCDCGFQSVCPLKKKDKRLTEAFWWERLPEGELGLVLMVGAQNLWWRKHDFTASHPYSRLGFPLHKIVKTLKVMGSIYKG